jgi:hypothetical protein
VKFVRKKAMLRVTNHLRGANIAPTFDMHILCTSSDKARL